MTKTKFHDGAVVLYKRGQSNIWQVRIKKGTGTKGWKRYSTGEADISKAEDVAHEKFLELKIKKKLGISIDSKSFTHCAEVAEKVMRIALDSGEGKVIYEDYIRTLHKYLIPFFGKKQIDTISYETLLEFDKFRIEKLGRVPAKSTVNNHNATLKRVFNIAVMNKWMKQVSIPSLSNTGRDISKQKVRPYFEDEELKTLLDFLKEWRGTGRKVITQQIRTILYDYAILITYTGIRPGTEADFIRFRDIDTFYKDDKKYASIRVNGKTGERVLTADRFTKGAIDRLADYLMATKPFNVDDNSYIFKLPCTGETPKDLGRAFKKALQECDLLHDKYGATRTLYSLRHSYATRILLKNETNIHLLARHMGTSVAMIEKYYSHVISMQAPERFILTDSFECDDLDNMSKSDLKIVRKYAETQR